MRHQVADFIVAALETGRRFCANSDTLFDLAQAERAQPLLEQMGRFRAQVVVAKAWGRCPAYRALLAQHSIPLATIIPFSDLPVTTKENYVRRWSVEERCYDGHIPATGTVIDESSGSSGTPNNWVRSRAERDDTKRLLQISYRHVFPAEQRVLLNCFALGPWATGMSVSMGLADIGILKSIGPDQKKLENTLTLFGPEYRYLIFGYPPFLKQFLDTTTLDLSRYHMDLVVGGEGMSEALRTHLRGTFRTVLSSYGASDLEINIGMETPMTIRLRRLCADDPVLCKALFGRETPPMLFQYNPLDFVIETLPGGELAFTSTRADSAAPKIRYNLHDLGGTLRFPDLRRILSWHGISLVDWPECHSAFPVLFLWGRSDLTVPFYGAKIYPSDIEQIIANDPELRETVHSFQIQSVEEADLQHCLRIHLEAIEGRYDRLAALAALQDRLFEGLCRGNQDFREVSRMFDRDRIQVIPHSLGSGPFAGQDIRIKNRYIG